MREEILKSFDISGVHVGKIYSFIDNGVVFLLSENGTSMLLEESLYNLLKEKACPEELLFKLIQRGFASVEGSPDVVDKEMQVLPTFFMITLTNNCNMRCKYCFHQFIPEHLSVLSEEMLDKILDYIITYVKTNNVPPIMIQAWGGEPLLCMSLLEYMYNKLEKSGIAYKLCLETNGTLLSEPIIKQLDAMKIEIGVSTDGIKEVQNKQRPLVNGKDSFELVSEGLCNMNKIYNGKFGSITVVTKDVLKHLEECIDYLDSQNGKGIKLNIARVSENMKMGLEKEEVVDFANRLVDKMETMFEEGHAITEGNIIDRLKNLLKRNEANICNSHGCQGGKKMISFDTRGNIYPCEMTDYPEECLGNVETDHNLIELIESRKGKGYFSKKDLSGCVDCPFKYFCGGGCTTAIIYQKGKVESIDELGCEFNKAMYRRLINLIINKPNLAEEMLGDARRMRYE